MSPELALVGLAIVPPVAGLAVAYGRFVRKITRDVQDNLAAATSVAEERISNIRTVKTFSKELREMETYKDKIHNVLTLGYKESLARAVFYGMTGFSGNIIIISVLYYGGVMVSDQTITVGNLSAFLLYAAYIGEFYHSVLIIFRLDVSLVGQFTESSGDLRPLLLLFTTYILFEAPAETSDDSR